MTDTRRKDVNWRIYPDDEGSVSFEQAKLAVFMDIRDELKRLNGIIHCPNFLSIPRVLGEIRRNTVKKRKRRV